MYFYTSHLTKFPLSRSLSLPRTTIFLSVFFLLSHHFPSMPTYTFPPITLPFPPRLVASEPQPALHTVFTQPFSGCLYLLPAGETEWTSPSESFPLFYSCHRILKTLGWKIDCSENWLFQGLFPHPHPLLEPFIFFTLLHTELPVLSVTKKKFRLLQ